jgi:hypothetical protein
MPTPKIKYTNKPTQISLILPKLEDWVKEIGSPNPFSSLKPAKRKYERSKQDLAVYEVVDTI